MTMDYDFSERELRREMRRVRRGRRRGPTWRGFLLGAAGRVALAVAVGGALLLGYTVVSAAHHPASDPSGFVGTTTTVTP